MTRIKRIYADILGRFKDFKVFVNASHLFGAKMGIWGVIMAFGLNAGAQKLPDLIPYRKGELWGYADSTKKIIIEPKYKKVGYFSDGMADVVLNDSSGGFIDSAGKIVFTYDPRNNSFENLFCGRIRIYDFKSGKFGYVNRQGRVVIPLVFDLINEEQSNDFLGGYAVVTKERKFGRGYSGKDKYGIIDTNGKFVFPYQKKIYFIYPWDGLFVTFHFMNDSLKIYDVKKSEFVMNSISKQDCESKKEMLLKKGYTKKEIDSLCGQYTPTVYDSYFLLSKKWGMGAFFYGYIDKYGTEYWED
jgi:hypothetical protein